MQKIYIGIDNGVSGTICIIDADNVKDITFIHTPIKNQQDYTKKKKCINRVDFKTLYGIFNNYKDRQVFVALERPMINAMRFNASISAARALESILILIEEFNYSYMFIDSKEWQKDLLPQGIKESKELKKASLDVGNRLYPQFREFNHPDRDGLLIAEYIKRKNY